MSIRALFDTERFWTDVDRIRQERGVSWNFINQATRLGGGYAKAIWPTIRALIRLCWLRSGPIYRWMPISRYLIDQTRRRKSDHNAMTLRASMPISTAYG